MVNSPPQRSSGTLLEAKIMAEKFLQRDNSYLHHLSLAYLTPDQFALQ